MASIRQDQYDPTIHRAVFIPHPGPQSRMFYYCADEICYGGAKGGGKSAASMAWLAWGNQAFLHRDGKPMPTDPTSVDWSYLNHPDYRALVLRRNQTDMENWIRKAKPLYQAYGGEYVQTPYTRFRFPSGAEIYIAHLKDASAWEKYAGWEIHRIVVEELTQLPNEELFLNAVNSCLRSVHPELVPQVLCTTNPKGPGHGWVKKRFVRPIAEDGSVIEPETQIEDPFSKTTRIFIPAKLTDNPSLMQNDRYMRRLMTYPEKMRRAYIEGDWDAMEGQYFEEFRVKRMVGEPEWANHVIEPVPLMPWWLRWMGGDWGYQHDAAFYWFCQNERDQRVHVYREFVTKKMTPFHIGAEIAKASLEDLAKAETRNMALFMGRDTWQDRDGGQSQVDGIAAGIKSILGDEGCLIREMMPKDNDADKALVKTLMERGGVKGRIVLLKAFQNKEQGFLHIHEMLRWQEVSSVTPEEYDPYYAKELQQKDPTGEEFRKYWMAYHNPNRETLPKMVIHGSACPKLITRIPEAVHDEKRPEIPKKVETDNELDALRYGLYSQHRLDVAVPESVFMRREMARLADRGPLDMSNMGFLHAQLQAKYHKQKKKSVSGVKIERIKTARTRYAI